MLVEILSEHHLGADAGTGMFKRLPEQQDGPTVANDREHHDAAAVPQHRGIERQMQGLAWLLPGLNRPEHQRAVESVHVNAAIGRQLAARQWAIGSLAFQ